MKSATYGHAGSFFTSCYVDIRLSMEKMKRKSWRRLLCSLSTLTVRFENILAPVWNKRSTKAKQLIMKMLAKRPEDRISAE
jgi:hypothetical protein